MGSFHDMQLYGEKIYKFQQGKTIRPLLQNATGIIDRNDLQQIEGGACAALVVDWIAERKATSNRWNVFGLRDSSTPGRFQNPATAASDQHHVKNRIAIMRAAPQQARYARSGDEHVIFSERGLREDGMKSMDANASQADGGVWHTMPNAQGGLNNAPVTDVLKTLTATSEKIGAHNGVYVAVRVSGRGHAVGMFRSNGNSLYFFDPNVGIYRVRRGVTQQFFGAWMSGYEARGMPVTMSRPHDRVAYFLPV